MARVICSICGWDTREHTELGRTGHLKHDHDIAPYDGVVQDYFLHPWEVTVTVINKKKQSVRGEEQSGS